MEEAIRELIRKTEGLERQLSEVRAGGIPLSLTKYMRFDGFVYSIDTDLDFMSFPSNWQWAGSPFVTPTYSIINESWLMVSPGSNQRAFLLAPGSPTFDRKTIGGVFMHASNDSTYVGVRLDNGTDNNYIEAVISASPNDVSQMRVLSRIRIGGGTVTETILSTLNRVFVYFFTVSFTGTAWSSWNVRLGLYNPVLCSNVTTSSVSFTPTRIGLVFYAPASWQFIAIDGLSGTWP